MGMIGNSLAQGLISGANIQDGTVDTPDLKDSAVTAAKIAAAVITPAKLSTGAPTWDTSNNFMVGYTSVYTVAGGGTTRVTVGYDQNNRTQLAVSNQNTGGSASAALTLGAYGADWTIGVGSSANNSNSLTITRATNEFARFDSSGNLLLGTTANASGSRFIVRSDGAQVRIGPATNSRYRSDYSVNTNGSGFINCYDDTGGVYMPFDVAASYLTLSISGAERARLDSSGRLGIGTSSPTTFVHAWGGSASGSNVINWNMRVSTGNSGSAAYGGVGAGIYLDSFTNNNGSQPVSGISGYLISGGSGGSSTDHSGGLAFYVKTSSSSSLSQVMTINSGGVVAVSSLQAANSTNTMFAVYNTTGSDLTVEAMNGSTPSISGMRVAKYASTSRSISCAGTVNQNGADYAEYMTKAGDFSVAKGEVVGINADGKITNVFTDAISFCVKSTDPGLVGGDKWFTEPRPKDEDGNEYSATAPEASEWFARMEAARATVDRIAFCGQVPVNVTGATAGQYIIPVNDNGAIKGEAVSNPTFEQYQLAVGKVIAIEDDGRARIIVKVA